MSGNTVYLGMSIQVKGLDDLLFWMRNSDRELNAAMRLGLKEAAQPVLQRARANASSIQDDGTMRGSLSIGARRSGAEIVLKSTDEAAGVKEFAHPGAMYAVKAHDKRANARKMGRYPVGVPHRANAPRVMIPAVEKSRDEVLDKLAKCLDDAMAKGVEVRG